MKDKITDWLKGTNSAAFSIYVIIAAFSTYACMYAFRKPYTATGFTDYELWGMNYKTILVIAQILGYTLSKYYGIKFIAELKSAGKGRAILLLIGFAHLMLLGFALVPYPYNFIFLFLNGFPLGMIWGLVFSYLEGRRFTELLGAGLSVSFVISSGFVKSVGKSLINAGVSEFWMPFLTGAIFALPLIIAVYLLDRIPPPSEEDKQLRTERVPMSGPDRIKFFRTFGPGLVLLLLVYMGLTAFRDLRDNFMADILSELGVDNSGVFAQVELVVSFAVLAVLGATFLIRNNMKALNFNLILVTGGLLLMGGAMLMFNSGTIGPEMWMILIGIGIYMGYIPFNCILFERLIAAFQYKSNAGFLIYVADALGYTAAIGILFYREFGQTDLSWVDFFSDSVWIMVIAGAALTAGATLYFLQKKRNWKRQEAEQG